ncbi:DNA-directed DNA polymerase [Tanacetum coccineum]
MLGNTLEYLRMDVYRFIDIVNDLKTQGVIEIVSKKVVTPAPVKAVEESCVTCGGAHSWYNCPATDNNQASVCATTGTYNQVNPPNRVSNQMAPPAQNNHAPNFQNKGFQNQSFQVPNNQDQQEISNDFSNYKRNNDQMLRNMQNQINSLKGDLKNEIQNTIKSQQAVMMNQQTTFQNNLQNMICGLFQNQASTSGTLPSNTIPNPKGEMKAITTRSGVAYEGPSIPTNPSPKEVVERETEETTDKEQTNFQGSTAQIQPPVIPISIPELDVPTTLPKTTPILESDIPKNLPKPKIPYPSRRDDQKSRDKASNQMEKIFQIVQDLRFDISFAYALLLMPRFAPTIKSLLMNKEKLLELAKIPLNKNCSAMLLKKLPKSLRSANFYCMTRRRTFFVKFGKFHFPTDFVVVDFEAAPRDATLYLGDPFLRTGRFPNSSGGNPIPTFEPFTSEFILEEIEVYFKDDSISPEIDHADCNPEEDICLIEKLLNNDPFQLPPMDLKQSEVTEAKSSIEEPPELELKDLPSHLEYAFLEENDKLPVIIAKGLKNDEKDALLKVLKSHKRAIAWKITDIKGIDPRFCTHKILMEDDYKPTVQSQRRVNPKIHEVIKKEVLKLLDAGMIYPISDSPWVSPVHCVPKKGGITVVANEENELILTWMIERLAGNEFYCFLDGFSGYFQIPIDPQDQEKTTFTCPYGTFAEGIVLGHKISKSGIEVDRAKVDVIAKLPHPTTVKGVRSFLGHAGFYRRFIQDFSKIARPMTHLLEKETPFVFSKDCIDAFQTLKKKLTEAPILVVPDWNLPFKLMCDASDFAIGAVLGQRKMKHFQPIHYASKTMTEA